MFGYHVLGFGAGTSNATVSFVTTAIDTGTATTYNGAAFQGVSIGTAAADRIVAVVVSGQEAARTISSVSIGGNAATNAVSITTTTGPIGIWYLAVPSGTTANIFPTFSGACVNASLIVYAIYGSSGAPTDNASNTSDPYSTTALAISASGVAIGGAHAFSTSTYGWTGLTEDVDEVVEGARTHTSASAAFVTAQSSPTITCDPSSTADGGMVVAAWGPV